MTTARALTEARKLFGEKAAIKSYGPCELYVDDRPRGLIGPLQQRCTQRFDHGQHCPGGVPHFSVGRIELSGLFFAVRGSGRSWEEALAKGALTEHHLWCVKCSRRNGKVRICPEGKRLNAALARFQTPTT